MFTYLKMKHFEWKVKLALYASILFVMENQKSLIEFLNKLYLSFKEASLEDSSELQEKLIKALADLAHSDPKKGR